MYIYNEIPTEALLFNCISHVEGHLGVEVQSFASWNNKQISMCFGLPEQCFYHMKPTCDWGRYTLTKYYEGPLAQTVAVYFIELYY